MWWGIWLVACNAKGGWKSAVGPIMMNFLLLNVSGADLLEKALRRSKPGFAAYADAVPKFVPWGYLRSQ
jgi:steroid 5-alpha reductase family enzyme